MMRRCPDCRRYFPTKPRDEEQLAESFKRNPELKFICTPCGKKIQYRYWLARAARR